MTATSPSHDSTAPIFCTCWKFWCGFRRDWELFLKGFVSFKDLIHQKPKTRCERVGWNAVCYVAICSSHTPSKPCVRFTEALSLDLLQRRHWSSMPAFSTHGNTCIFIFFEVPSSVNPWKESWIWICQNTWQSYFEFGIWIKVTVSCAWLQETKHSLPCCAILQLFLTGLHSEERLLNDSV